MAKTVADSNLIGKAKDLVTSRAATRAGFIAMALEKNYMAVPYIEEAKTLKSLALKFQEPMDLLTASDLRFGLLAAAGLSDKALSYLQHDDHITAIKTLIKAFLEPAGENFVDDLVYRYLLTKGDSLGGKARNLAGSMAERKLIRSLLSAFNLAGIEFQWLDNESKKWLSKSKEVEGIEKRVKAIHWTKKSMDRLLVMNINVPAVKKNIDMVLLSAGADELKNGKDSIFYANEKYLALGELKGGIDPAGADEHWKTANSALNRIRMSFQKKKLYPKTFFIGAAIENSMAEEIFDQTNKGILGSAANLTHEDQLTNICNWLINL